MKTEGKRNLLRQPDEIRLMTGSAQTEQETAPDAAAFRAGDVTVELAEADGSLAVFVQAQNTPVRELVLTWKAMFGGTGEVLGDTWERGYGDLEWKKEADHIGMPWYFFQHEAGKCLAFGVKVRPSAMCWWEKDGADVKLEWGNVWTFTGGELETWYQENKTDVTDWHMRMKELIGLRPDNEADYFTAMWAEPEDIFRPAYTTDIETTEMTDCFSEDVSEEYKAWFDANIISSYFDGKYPWTRLGYTYDWADNGAEYGLSEFIVKKDSEVKVAYTVDLNEMLQKLEQNSWNPQNGQ